MGLFKHSEKNDDRIGKTFDLVVDEYGPEEFSANNMIYAGKISDDRFSIAYVLHDWSNSGVNMYYPVGKKTIKNRSDTGDKIETYLYGVKDVGEERLTLEYLGKVEKKD